MSSKRIFLYFLEVQNEDSSIVKYKIEKSGKTIFITNEHGYEHIKHPGFSLEDEIRIVFKAKILK